MNEWSPRLMIPVNCPISSVLIQDVDIRRAERVLIDNGIEEDEAAIVLQAIGYALLGEDLYAESNETSMQ